MSRYTCERCGADENTLNPPHLCRDIRKRHERQAKAVAIVAAILEDIEFIDPEVVALEIVQALSGRDLGTD